MIMKGIILYLEQGFDNGRCFVGGNRW